MQPAAVISVDGHARASRTTYREYFEVRYLEAFDNWVAAAEGTPDAGNLNPAFGESAQWNSAQRQHDLESNGIVAEVLFPNGVPFESTGGFTEPKGTMDAEVRRQGRMAHNRWLADFCADTPGRRSGQAVISFEDVDQAVEDIHWAKEHGLGGIAMPALEPGGVFFFDPVLDPVWATCQDLQLPVSQHGGLGAPPYQPPGFAAILTLALEHSFYSGRCLWQLMLGGVFERFPGLRVVFVETGAVWIPLKLRELDSFLATNDDWTGFAASIGRERTFSLSASEYWERNCAAGISPFGRHDLVVLDGIAFGREQPRCIKPDKLMFGVDYPHFESIFPHTSDRVAELVTHYGLSDGQIRGVLYKNAAGLYGFDLTLLEPEMERIGFNLESMQSKD